MRLFSLRSIRSQTRAQWLGLAAIVAGVAIGLEGRGWGWAGAALCALGTGTVVLAELARTEATLLQAARQQEALLQLQPLLGDFPVWLGGWAADPLLMRHVVELLAERRPRLVVECGSGSSTVILARCLRRLGGGRLVSLEHDPEFAGRTLEQLRLHGLTDLVTLVTAPLIDRPTPDGHVLRWYAPVYESALREPVDLLLVDGPPGAGGPRARYPAVPLLAPHLAPGCVVLLDDGDRPDERAIAETWARELRYGAARLATGRGAWLLQRA
jgi:predicted O-methyltransferase YrrM